MALKKRFREAARNEFRLPICFSSVLSGLDDCYYCSNIIVSLLFKLCAKFSLRLQERSKVGACCPENRFCLPDGKILNKSPDHLFDLNFFDSMLNTIGLLASVQSFLILVAEVPRKNSSFSAVLFFSASAPVFLFAVLQSLSLLFLCKIFWAGKRNSSSSWKSLFAGEKNYFIRVLTSLISLQWVMYEGSF